jgi:hypothetical protein
VSPAFDGCEEPVNPDRHMESHRTGVLAAWLNLIFVLRGRIARLFSLLTAQIPCAVQCN